MYRIVGLEKGEHKVVILPNRDGCADNPSVVLWALGGRLVIEIETAGYMAEVAIDAIRIMEAMAELGLTKTVLGSDSETHTEISGDTQVRWSPPSLADWRSMFTQMSNGTDWQHRLNVLAEFVADAFNDVPMGAKIHVSLETDIGGVHAQGGFRIPDSGGWRFTAMDKGYRDSESPEAE